MSEKPSRVVQITDCHLGEVSGTELLSMNPDESLADVLALIGDNHAENDLLIATGDLANEPSPAAYQRLYDTLSATFVYPFAWLPGNHDDPAVMETFGKEVNVKLHVLDHWLIVLLDSRVEGCIYGNLSDAELQFLNDALIEYADKHVMVCLHHQPVPIGSQWMDNYIVRNAKAFWDVIEQHSTVKIVLWGHIHQEFSDQHHSIALLATPSTCIQFAPGKKDFQVDNTMPAYRWFELNSDGTFVSGVERVAEKDYGTDLESHGY
ncbi:MAG: Icc protein [Candidatus Endobugula sp.]|jgi:Icc protein